MHKIDSGGSVEGQFVDADINNNIAGTKIAADWLNAIQDEMVNVVELSGGTLDKTNTRQFYDAILRSMQQMFVPVYAYSQNANGAGLTISTLADNQYTPPARGLNLYLGTVYLRRGEPVPAAAADYTWLKIINQQVILTAYATNISGSEGLAISTRGGIGYITPSPIGKTHVGSAFVQQGDPVPTAAADYIWREIPGKIRVRLDPLTAPVGSGTIALSESVTNFTTIYIIFSSNSRGGGVVAADYYYYFSAYNQGIQRVGIHTDLIGGSEEGVEFTADGSSVVINNINSRSFIKEIWGIR